MGDEKQTMKLNEQKSEIRLCKPASRRERVPVVPVESLLVGEASTPFLSVVKTLGVTLDAQVLLLLCQIFE